MNKTITAMLALSASAIWKNDEMLKLNRHGKNQNSPAAKLVKKKRQIRAEMLKGKYENH